MTKFNKLLLAGTSLAMTISLTSVAQAQSAPSERADKILKHWTADKIAAAEPRDMVIDHRGLGYIKGKKGKLTPYGHSNKPELTSPDSKRSIGASKLGDQVTQDNQAPTVTSRTPADGATIGASQTFSAVVTDVDGVRDVTFELDYNGQTYTFTGNNVGNDTWETTVDGFTTGSGSWRIISRDRVKRKGGNTATTSSYGFTVDGTTPPPSGGGVVVNSRWTNGGAIQTSAGRLLYEMPDGGGWSGYVCSGTVTNDGVSGRSVIITAAHCVYDDADAAFARNVIFIPNQDQTTGTATDRDCSNDPEGCWVTDFGVVEQNWTTSVFPDNIPWDYAYYVVGDTGNHSGSGTGGALDTAVGTVDVDFSAPNVDDGQAGESSQDWTHALGYSYSDDPFFMYSAEDMTTEGADNWWLPSSQLSGGSSGGPWIQPMDEATGTGPLMSVNSWGYTTSDGMAGPFLNGNTAECLFEAAKSGSLALNGNADGEQGLVVDPATCGGGTANTPPSASFSADCTDLSCSFTDGSSDSDGSVTSWNWSFGDGSSATDQNAAYSYSAAGTYTVNLTVTDNDGASTSTSQTVTVTDGGGNTGGGVTLSAVSAYKVKGKKRWDYSWSGASTSNVDIYRDGSRVATTANDGAYTLTSNLKGGGSHTHQVCEAGTSTCSSVVNSQF